MAHYRVLGPKGDIVVDGSGGAACFVTYNRSSAYSGKGICEVFIYLKNSKNRTSYQSPFNREQIKHHIIGLCNAGFPLLLIEESDRFVVRIKEEDCLNQSQMRIALDYIRICWEQPLVMEIYFKMPQEYRDRHDYFMLIQAISCWKIGGGHTLPSTSYKFVMHPKQIMDFLRDNRSHNSGSLQVWYSNLAKKDQYALFTQEVEKVINSGKLPAKMVDVPTHIALPVNNLKKVTRRIVRKKSIAEIMK
jgi:hypothetical protein